LEEPNPSGHRFAGLVQIGLHFWHWPYETIALIDTGSEVPGVSLGILVSAPRALLKEAFAAKDAFQKAAASGGHIRTKIVTLKDQLAVGQPVQPAHLAESK
jgi:hypothetical protein